MIISQSYDYLLKEFGQDRINHRIKSLYERAIAFIKKEGLIDKVGVNSEILRVVVLDYFADIQRLKNFNSDLEHTNLHKIYAYSCYWWIRRKPIQLWNNNINNENLVYINEKFMASYLLYEMLTINNLNKYSLLDIDYNEKEETEYMELLEYFLIYRVKNAYSIEMMLETFEFSLKLMKRKMG